MLMYSTRTEVSSGENYNQNFPLVTYMEYGICLTKPFSIKVLASH